MNTLHIDTSKREEVTVKVITDETEFEEVVTPEFQRMQITLAVVDSVVKKSGIPLENLDNISINRGPGSFTGLRVGGAIANALSYALQKPFKNQKLSYSEEVVY